MKTRTFDSPQGWTWIDVELITAGVDELLETLAHLHLDPLSVRDAVEDIDLPKVDDFGASMSVVFHGLGEATIATYEIDCFLTDAALVTIHRGRSPALDALYAEIERHPQLAHGGPDELMARLADVVSRRLLTVLDTFDNRYEDLIDKALNADDNLLAELTAVRRDLATVRRIVHPQREVLDQLRASESPLISDAGRRRFHDVFDIANRVATGLDAARTSLAETLEAYRGAEARQATDVTKVLTIYAAIMLPLSLIAGFFGMNFVNLPWLTRDWGWIVVTAVMGFIAVLSLGIFVALGWIERPSGREAGRTLGRGLAEAARAPVQVFGAVYEITTMPVRRDAEADSDR